MPFLNLSSHNMHYQSQGKGPTAVLLLHGNFASWHWWKPFLKDLPASFTAYAPDLRGSGDSSEAESGYSIEALAEDIIALANELELDQFHLVGHSLGGAVAQQISGLYPERILTLTLVATAPADGIEILSGNKASSLINLMSPETTFGIVNKLGLQRSSFHSSFKRLMPGIPEGKEFDRLVNDAIRVEEATFKGFLDSLRCWRGSGLLNQFDFPVLFINGQNDKVVPPETLQFMIGQLPNSRVACWKDVGHAPQLEKPDAFNALLIRFIEGHITPEELPATFEQTTESWWTKFKRFLAQIGK